MSTDTCVIDVEDWLGADTCTIGDVGFGLLGSEIAASGTAGPGYAYNDLSLPADANKEICGQITTWPAFGTLFAYEDTSFIYTRSSDGADSFAYQLYVDGVAVGSPQTVTLAVGTTTTINLTGATATQSASSGTGIVTATPAAAGVVNLAGSSATQGGTSATGEVSIVPPASGTVNLAGASASQSAGSSTGTVSVTPYVAGIINLAGSDTTQTATCGVALVSSGQYARAPAGSGYSPRSSRHAVRPADIQGYNR